MKAKKNSFSKIITFCVLALFLITNMILFTSCDNGNSPNDNTNEEQNNNAPTDYCKICDGVQDKNHQHDYCGKCEGTQTTPHTCPVELKAEVEHIGNGTYTIANFMVHNDEVTPSDSIQDKVNVWIPLAETHIRKLVDNFSNEFKTNYSEQLALITDENAFKQNNDFGFDFTINRLNDSCSPIFQNVISKVNDETGFDQCNIIGYYKAFANEAKKKATSIYYDAYFQYDENYKLNALNAYNFASDSYTIEKDAYGNVTNAIFNPDITNKMDELLTKHSESIGISTSDLQNLINVSLTISSLDAMHDYAVDQKLSTHATTCDGKDNLIDESMIEMF